MSNLALTLWDQGDLAAARDLEEQTLETSTRVLGPEHPDTLRAMCSLALTLAYLGDLDGARGLLEQGLETRTRVLGPEHPDTLWTKDLLDAVLAEAAEEPAESSAS